MALVAPMVASVVAEASEELSLAWEAAEDLAWPRWRSLHPAARLGSVMWLSAAGFGQFPMEDEPYYWTKHTPQTFESIHQIDLFE